MYLTSLNPSFFFCKMVILVTPTTQGDKMNIKITGTGTCTQYMVNKCYIHVDIFSSSFHFSFPLLALFLPFPSLSFCGRQTLSKVTSMMPHHGQMCSCLCVIPSPWVSVGSVTCFYQQKMAKVLRRHYCDYFICIKLHLASGSIPCWLCGSK